MLFLFQVPFAARRAHRLHLRQPRGRPCQRRCTSAVCGAGRALGYVCAPSIFQKMIARCQGVTSDVSVYERNRDVLAGRAARIRLPMRAAGRRILSVRQVARGGRIRLLRARQSVRTCCSSPGDDFGCKGYVRIAYCVSPAMIERLAAFLPQAGGGVRPLQITHRSRPRNVGPAGRSVRFSHDRKQAPRVERGACFCVAVPCGPPGDVVKGLCEGHKEERHRRDRAQRPAARARGTSRKSRS